MTLTMMLDDLRERVDPSPAPRALDLTSVGRPHAFGVVTVPKTLSPFRYAGGKTWLVPEFQRWLDAGRPVATLVEPFAGGGIVTLSIVAANPGMRGVMCEKDEDVGAVWSVIVSGSDADAFSLCDRIQGFKLTRDTALACLSKAPVSTVDRAFQTILRNRVNRGGILAKRASLIKEGQNGKGISSRWYPETLVKRIVVIRGFRDRLEFVQGDAFDLIERFADREDAALFVDPPYTAGGKNAGSRLYTHFEIDHVRLFRDCSALSGRVLMTYDDSEEVRRLASTYGLSVSHVPMRNAHNRVMQELIITG